MNVRAPSGAVFELEPPRLRAVLVEGGSDEALIRAVWVHQMDPDALLEEDRSFVLEWCIDVLAEDEEAAAFTAVCEQFGQSPSERLRITDPVLAYECDLMMRVALVQARAEARETR